MNNKTMILILVTINTVQNIILAQYFNKCHNMDFFNQKQRKDFIYLKQTLKLNPIGEGNFGKVHDMFFSTTNSPISE